MKILDQARTIERQSKEVQLLHTSYNPHGRVETIGCDSHTCEHVIENKDMSKRLAYYENAHGPSSKNNLPTQQAKRNNRKDSSEYKKLVQRLVIKVHHTSASLQRPNCTRILYVQTVKRKILNLKNHRIVILLIYRLYLKL